MICDSGGKEIVRMLWEKAIEDWIPSDPQRYYFHKSGDPTGAQRYIDPSCLWLASDDFRDVLPIMDRFQTVHIPERDNKSQREKQKFMGSLAQHVTVFKNSIEEVLEYENGQNYMVINLDMVGHYNLNTFNLVKLSLDRINKGGLLFLTVASSSRNTRGGEKEKRLADGQMGVIHHLAGMIESIDHRMIFVDGFPRSYRGDGERIMHAFGWRIIS